MNSDTARIVLVGDGPTAESALRSLIGRFDVVAVVRTVDDEAADPVARVADEAGITVLAAPNTAALEVEIDRLAPDLVVVSSYSRILPDRLISQRPFLNVHYADLPRYRGRANVNWALINGESHVGIAIHRIVEGVDAGPIIARDRIPIGERDDVTDLYAHLNERQAELLPDAIIAVLHGETGTVQDPTEATYCCGRVPDDGLIDWAAGTDAVDRLIRALTAPYPGAFTFCGTARIVVDEASPVADATEYVGRVPGRVVQVHRRSGEVDVLTGDGVLRLRSIRVDGESCRPADVISSVSATLGLFPLDFLRASGLIGASA
ncbi:methionyl-tRNA formyltransferase [Microbacterium sp. Bi121]|uniref:methionyl-tRNA formyltransferase n=1 Tax=Microbacterium sp. Bi121 TaxID=2822348 RepID=UPI001D1EE0FC|nr:methionyl-tRNA formyltransferase [Microbacterium sp. Bi121]CAH0122849.1 Bifunctional polymyxin resistance protein ArnA [Microbacterium sp. Bi121]